jgi:hypothetical protein
MGPAFGSRRCPECARFEPAPPALRLASSELRAQQSVTANAADLQAGQRHHIGLRRPRSCGRRDSQQHMARFRGGSRIAVEGLSVPGLQSANVGRVGHACCARDEDAAFPSRPMDCRSIGMLRRHPSTLHGGPLRWILGRQCGQSTSGELGLTRFDGQLACDDCG